MHNLSYIHINQWELRRFSSISPLLSIHPPKLMTGWLFVDITSAQLPLRLSGRPSKLMYDLLFVDIAFTQFASPPTIPPSTQTYVLNSPSLGSSFFLFFFFFWHYCFYFIRLQRLFCTSVVGNSHMIIYLQWKMESLYQGLLDMIFEKQVQASSLKIWNKKLFYFSLV